MPADAISRLPDPERCFGRDACCEQIIKNATDAGSVLLFGSRQSGKSTILLRIQQLLLAKHWPSYVGVVPIYLNLLSLPPEAVPSDAFNMLAKAAWTVSREVYGNAIPDSLGPCADLETLIGHLEFLRRVISRPDTRFVFMMDESKRVLSQRFPRGFQDNIFALLYGEHPVAGYCSMVFTGAQELCRAVFELVRNLPSDAVVQIISNREHKDIISPDTVGAQVYELAGGQAGLSVRLALDPSWLSDTDEQHRLESLRQKHSSLLRVWATALSAEARLIQEVLVQNGFLECAEIPARLKSSGFDQYRADRVCEELEFSGIAIRLMGRLKLVNKIYGEFIKTHISNQPGSNAERGVWSSIEQVELALRRVIRDRYSSRWSGVADNQMKSVLGTESWEAILANRDKSARSYRYTSHTPDGDLLHFAYFGQLSQLMLSNNAWDMFKPMFRDKRELEDVTADIVPVRNDSAHFRSLPSREAERCRLRCQDLIRILQRHYPALV
jgi:hypothetical protein